MHVHDAKIRVRYQETDKMGVVYYGNYYTWFEVGRNEFFRSIGRDCVSLEEEGIFLPVIESQCRYKHAAKYDDEIIVRTVIEELTRAKIELNYQILRKKDELLLAEGKTIHGFVDKDLKPLRLKKLYPEIWEELSRCING
jgi:acyl-CoA thioester hydrolase